MAERLWLDDRRTPPWGYSLWAKTARAAIEMLQSHEVEHCSLDHDLAEEHYNALGLDPIPRDTFAEPTGYAVVEWMVETGRWVADISVHTLNERGGGDMIALIRKHAPHVKCRRVDPHEV